jgi:hypothetical protein
MVSSKPDPTWGQFGQKQDTMRCDDCQFSEVRLRAAKR